MMGIWVTPRVWSVQVKLLWMWRYVSRCGHLLFFLLGTDLRAEWVTWLETFLQMQGTLSLNKK